MRMEETRERCTELQEEEIGTLDAIYPDHLSATLNADTGLRMLDLQIPIVLPGNVSIDLVPAFSRTPGAPSDVSSTAASSSSTTALAVSHLPPISVRLTLPADYPSLAPPMITSLRATIPGESVRTAWLSRKVLQTVSDKVRQVWEDERLFDTGGGAEGLGMLWQWWEWVANGDFLQDSGLLNAEQLRLTIPPSLSAAGLFTLLNRYNAQQIHSSFESTAFACAICFESRKGKKCAQMPCGCVFCHSCLHSCWTLAITEGSLEAVSCPDPGCVKKRATKSGAAFDDDDSGVDGSLVESLVGRDLTERWQELKNRRRAEIDPTYCICPRPGCQAPVPPPAPESATPSLANTSSRTIRLSDLSSSSSSSASSSVSPLAPTPSSISTSTDDRWARYRQCPTCSYSFCLYCSATWHGPHAPCSFPQTSALVLEYLSYPPDSPERVRMEQRRGKKNIERMVGKYLEEEENKKWLDERTRACAGCGVRVEKSHGCNHMTCGRCGAHFCYRCGISIKPTDPYEHYRRPGSSCFEKLFDQEEIARFERETAMQQAGLGVQLIGDEWGPRGVWEW